MTDPAEPTLRLVVDADDCPCRLDVYLAAHLESLSRSRVQRLIRDGAVLVDHQSSKPRLTLQGGEVIVVDVPALVDPLPRAEPIELEILYEDGDLLVVNKPPGMVVHPGAGVRSGTLVNALLHHCQDLSGIGGVLRPGIVHRLDRLTSGCLCVAKNDFAHQGLSSQLADRTMRRVYIAWALGEMSDTEGRVDAPIGRSPRNPTRMAVVQRGGRSAATRWRVTARAPGLTGLECRLETGRTHQIRVHLAHIGHPVVGDREYGPEAKRAKQLIPPGQPAVVQALSRCRRQLLHARQVSFRHPRSGEKMDVCSPHPEDFAVFEAAVLGAPGA